jgi:hypothetical protein
LIYERKWFECHARKFMSKVVKTLLNARVIDAGRQLRKIVFNVTNPPAHITGKELVRL